MREKTCCFTGHRKITPIGTIEVTLKVKKEIESLIDNGYNRFICGGALGFDTICALSVLKAQKKHPNIKLILALPCENQTNNWQAKDVEIYEEIKDRSNQVIYTSETYYSGCMFKRNRFMVDNSSVCICYMTKNSGGTAYTVNYAKEHGVTTKNLADK